MNRQDANRKILEKIAKLVDENPELRFGQILFILGINENIVVDDGHSYCVDEFYTESVDLLNRMTKNNEGAV
jgi:hypothetical protein